ncbi:hypothetical protein [Polyangium fumosum]|uniref:Uncharacterized protein n=1 Tax=Polyangium fumosum TaxID=889272 RepID=A0A4U1J2B1_9BACT|nr:hypothetical protein [Polyangium fumosum]TKD01246.1 hypothetical protein E8A74_32120 [Polyangium fumosum]
MKHVSLDPLDGPSVILSSEEHTVVTNELREATKGIARGDLAKLWAVYKSVYKSRPHWRKAIAHYFLD